MSREKIVFLDKTKPARRLAIKVASIKDDSVHNRVKIIKAEQKMAFCLTKPNAGDHNPKPAMKMPAAIREMSPLRVKQEFIKSCGLSARGRKRMSEEFKPTRLSTARRLIAEIMAEL